MYLTISKNINLLLFTNYNNTIIFKYKENNMQIKYSIFHS